MYIRTGEHCEMENHEKKDIVVTYGHGTQDKWSTKIMAWPESENTNCLDWWRGESTNCRVWTGCSAIYCTTPLPHIPPSLLYQESWARGRPPPLRTLQEPQALRADSSFISPARLLHLLLLLQPYF